MSAPRVHHVNAGTLCPFAVSHLVDGEAMVCHCLIVETDSGLVLVDTGFGTADIANPKARLGGAFASVARPRLAVSETMLSHVEALGFKRNDVRHILVTHLDLDHAGGLSDFPDAAVHVYGAELDAATNPRFSEKNRYRSAQWAHGPKWQVHREEGDDWFGFRAVRAIGSDIALVPLIGHSRGHSAIAVRTKEGWLLHAGDAYFHHREMNFEKPSCPPLLAVFQRLVAADDMLRRVNQMRLRTLVHERSEVRVLSAHCPKEFSSLSSQIDPIIAT